MRSHARCLCHQYWKRNLPREPPSSPRQKPCHTHQNHQHEIKSPVLQQKPLRPLSNANALANNDCPGVSWYVSSISHSGLPDSLQIQIASSFCSTNTPSFSLVPQSKTSRIDISPGPSSVAFFTLFLLFLFLCGGSEFSDLFCFHFRVWRIGNRLKRRDARRA